MGIVQLPLGRGRGQVERTALRRGLATGVRMGPLKVVRLETADAMASCAGCAAPIEFGSVTRAGQAYCSIECSLGGDHKA
jgi:hypothetical protein